MIGMKRMTGGLKREGILAEGHATMEEFMGSDRR